MQVKDKIIINHFSDVLCIWAYIGQIRLDELLKKYPQQLHFHYHFIQVFGAVEDKMKKNWQDRGGVLGYAQHVQDISVQYPHIKVHPELWTINIPTSSSSCHLFIKAVQNLIELNEISQPIGTVIWQLRVAFFEHLIDISDLNQQLLIAENLSLPVDKIKQQITSGKAHASLEQDLQLKQTLGISGSPTFSFNSGRQTLYGNVGFRLIDANIQELINEPHQLASWC